MRSDNEQHTTVKPKVELSLSVCARVVSELNFTQRTSIISGPLFERLKRKSNDIMAVLQSTANDWNETLHIMLFRFACGSHNLAAAERLARTATNRIAMRENSSIEQIEALLLGSAGLLDIYGDDDYVVRLRREFDHLAAKYNITPLAPSEWQFSGMYIHNHPVLRLAQLAACIHKSNISLHTILDCYTRTNILDLFSAQASTYWIENFLPGSRPTVSRRIGSFKSDILGINLVIPMMYAYGEYTNSKELISRAVALLESIPAEDNRYMKEWISYGVTPLNAFESQALLQLSKVYCELNRCEECQIAQHIAHISNKR